MKNIIVSAFVIVLMGASSAHAWQSLECSPVSIHSNLQSLIVARPGVVPDLTAKFNFPTRAFLFSQLTQSGGSPGQELTISGEGFMLPLYPFEQSSATRGSGYSVRLGYVQAVGEVNSMLSPGAPNRRLKWDVSCLLRNY